MTLIDIVVLIAIILVVTLVIARYIYKRIKNIPTGDCAFCSTKTGVDKMIKNIKKELDAEKCNCEDKKN